MNSRNISISLLMLISLQPFLHVRSANSADLIQRQDFVYKGAFKVPHGKFGPISTINSSFSTGAGVGLAFNPTNNSLFLVGALNDLLVAEISIPTLVNSTNKDDLNYATVLQDPTDISAGVRCYIGPGGASRCGSTSVLLGGLLVHPSQNRIIGTSYMPYDGNADSTRTHFTANKDWTTSVGTKGMYTLNGNVPYHRTAGFVGGYMTWVPPDQQNTFGSVAATGQAALSVITRTSYGPSLFLFDPDDLGNGTLGEEDNPVKATPLVYYPAEHPTLGQYTKTNIPNPSFGMTTKVRAVVWPEGARSVLFFGRTSLGPVCYGFGTANPDEAATHDEIVTWITANNGQDYKCGNISMNGSANDYCCFDNVGSTTHGTHSYPYAYYVWAYDTNDLLDVKNGVKKPWEITPYAEWDLSSDLDRFPTSGDIKDINGAAYDSSTQTVYVSQVAADTTTTLSYPIIHAFQLVSLKAKVIPLIKSISEKQ